MCLNKIYKNYTIDEEGKMCIDFKSTGLIRTQNDKAIGLPCGNCPECWNRQSSEWAYRCLLESKEHKENCVLTLTYNDEFVPDQLNKRDYQLFLKRLRKAIYPAKIKYFLSGEYGSIGGRPHFHCVIFGWRPKDCVFYKCSRHGVNLYNSAFLDSLWTAEIIDSDTGEVIRKNMGFITVDPQVNYKSCYYSAKYLQKFVYKLSGKKIQPPFVAMSKGIALAAALRFNFFVDDYIYIDGKKVLPPRYFMKMLIKHGKVLPETYRRWLHKRMPRYELLNLPVWLRRGRAQKRAVEKELSNEAKWYEFSKKVGISLDVIRLLC